MLKKGNVFLLIKSLTKSEKRYFRLYASKGVSETNYLRLFNVIEKQEEYDENGIKNIFKKEKFADQLHVTKIYLFELILKSLKDFHNGRSVNDELLELIRDIEILFDKELYGACHYKIQKAEMLALKNEKLALLHEILSWKRKLVLVMSAGNRKEVNGILEMESDVLEKLKTLNTYWRRTINLFEIMKDEKALKGTMTERPAKTDALQAKILHHHILFSVYFIKRNISKSQKEISSLIVLLEEHPERIEDDPTSYATAISNKISMLLAQKKWDEIPGLIRKIRDIPSNYTLRSENIFYTRLWLRTYNVELEMYRDSMQLEKGIRLIEEIKDYIAKHKKSVPRDYEMLFYYQFAYIFFLKKDFHNSLIWINEILNGNFGEIRIDIQCYARILNLIVHFELNNIIVLRYAVDSCRRFLKKKKILDSFKNNQMRLFSRLSLASAEEYMQIFEKSYSEIFSDSSEKSERALDYLDLKSWMQEKMQGKTKG
jgi:hypothetical protein